ncbi:uncharacterized protein K452DRAFT_290748 [Aplosporella prunicola CBS 121167]|uniref:Uncharacterized protein n=1 Tax=Aplosporella prunicola CBS 121167 TaxID=1176127 RepID=A0A6A6B5T3_9PEZI|nr:uncharacterized protein K452DRAFT_290748 [Aplosporella prunicola CBS 121167]KAF2138604.1 hypothetical protein K452DRAFT_290748 [Aplosporella prunicola CBS 121167]
MRVLTRMCVLKDDVVGRSVCLFPPMLTTDLLELPPPLSHLPGIRMYMRYLNLDVRICACVRALAHTSRAGVSMCGVAVNCVRGPSVCCGVVLDRCATWVLVPVPPLLSEAPGLAWRGEVLEGRGGGRLLNRQHNLASSGSAQLAARVTFSKFETVRCDGEDYAASDGLWLDEGVALVAGATA